MERCGSRLDVRGLWHLGRCSAALVVCALGLVTAVAGDPPSGSKVTLVAVGDMMLGNWAETLLDRHGPDYPFVHVAEIVRGADIATGNLEGPHCTVGEPMDKRFTFRMRPADLDGYRNAGFDVLNVANNHAMDYGADCFLQSNAEVQRRGMRVCGGGPDLARANRPAVVEAAGLRVAFLGYSATFPEEAWATDTTPGTVFPARQGLIRAVERAAQEHDLLVVHFHWGREGTQELREYQTELARLVIDRGADLVVGHHPHVLQGVEVYRDRLIFYSLGNFTFASYSEKARTAVVARVTLDGTGAAVAAEVIPLNVDNHAVELQPRPMPGDAAVLAELRQASAVVPGGRPPLFDDDGRIRWRDEHQGAAP